MRSKPRPPRKRNTPPAIRPALSPKSPPPALASGRYGTAGRTGSNALADPTAGRHGETCPHPARNTNRSARMGGAGIAYWEPAEHARESLTHVGAPHITRTAAGVRLVAGQEAKQRHAGESEGIRQPAMAERSVLTTLGAVAIVDRQPVWLGDAG
jgi:hypothetical protein